MDFDVEMDVVVDEVLAWEAEEFAGAVVPAVGGVLQLEDQSCGYAGAPMRGGDGQVVEVDFAAFLLKLAELIRREATDRAPLFVRGEGDETIAPQQAIE